ncbi:MAG: type II toxin-antitoxin system VapC family toxin [Proteiniphilum sp.]|jgi:tRNA(fMet)-specific endonuclease VapC|nr:type II toxin-antitoxin system VapC family toxin [Proteiniphilum sp.]
MIFLDTNIISYYFNANNNVKEKLMEAVDDDVEICTTIINIYEIVKGFRWKNNRKKEDQFREFLEDVVVFSIDDDVINIASDLYAQLRKKGKTIGDADIFIAAIVIKNNGTLISNNTKHYEDIEQLNLINWL